jgi:hypothetical protein
LSAAYQILKNAQVGAVILGAGFGRRFGSDKRVAALGNTTVAAQTVRHYCEVFARLKVVLKTEDTALAELLGQHAEIIFTDQSHLGMGHSLAAGFANLDWQWAFVGLLDMPFLRPASLEKVALTALNTQQKIIRPVFTPQQTNQDATTLQGNLVATKERGGYCKKINLLLLMSASTTQALLWMSTSPKIYYNNLKPCAVHLGGWPNPTCCGRPDKNYGQMGKVNAMH